MSATTIVEATRNSKRPRQHKPVDSKTTFLFSLREIIIQEQIEDREKNIPDRGYKKCHRFVSADLRERRYYVYFVYITNECNLFFVLNALAIACSMNRHAWVIFYRCFSIFVKVKPIYCYRDNESSTRGLSTYAQYTSHYRSYEISLFINRTWVQ
jgi:hypothetical protein